MENKILTKVFTWMFMGLIITFGVGYLASVNGTMLSMAYDFYYLFAIIEIIIVIYLSAKITKMSGTSAKTWFLVYSVVSGITFGSIFIVFKLNMIIFAFLIAAAVFAFFAVIGAKTKIDLSKMGIYLMMALLAVILCLIINIFVHNSTLELVVTIISLLIFIGFTAYDVQKIKQLEAQGFPEDNLAIYGALTLYLDFINIFIDILRLLNNSRN